MNFDSLPDRKEREYFNNIPTTFSLPEEQVDRLRDVAGRLLYSNKEFRKLLDDIGATIPVYNSKTDQTPAELDPREINK